MNILFPNENIKTLENLGEYLKQQKEEVTVTFLNGEYYGTLILEDLSCPEVQFIAPDGATITGGKKILCTFKRISPDILETNIGTNLNFERLKIDGDQKILARYPKYRRGERLNGSASLSEIEKITSSFPNVSGAYLHSLHAHEWGGNDYIVTGKQGNHLSLSWIGNNNRGNKPLEKCCYIENLQELLTGENEWYYDKNSGALRIFDDSAESEKISEITVFDRINLVEIHNCRNTKITFSGFTFADTDRTTFRMEWVRYLRSDWAFNYGSAVEIRGSENITFSDCDFQNLGSNGIGIFDYNDNITVNNCKFTDCLTNGILILGNPDSTYCTSSWEDNNHIAEIENKGKTGASSNDYPRNILIDNCLFYNLGIEDKQSAGVCISLAHRVTVSNSTLCYLPRAGINICENAFGGHTVKDCDLFDCVRETGDHGPFNSWGRDRFWSLGGYDTEGKRGEIKKEFALCDMLEENRIIHNRVVGNHGFGIDLDDGSTNYIIENNFCFGVGIKLREGFFRTVKNNVIVNAPLDLHATYAGNDDVVENNVVFNKQPIRIALLNSGFTTKINDNYFLNSSNKSKKQKILRGTQNSFLNADISDILDNNVSFSGFNRFEYEFGRQDAPKPIISSSGAVRENRVKIRNKYGVFVSMDEGLRSATGAPDLSGLYVERLYPFSKLKKRGIEKNDVLITVDGKSFTGSKHDFAEILNGSKTEVIRQQRRVSL